MRENVRLGNKLGFIASDVARPLFPQCSCTRRVYWPGTHKESPLCPCYVFALGTRHSEENESPSLLTTGGAFHNSVRYSRAFHSITPAFPLALSLFPLSSPPASRLVRDEMELICRHKKSRSSSKIRLYLSLSVIFFINVLFGKLASGESRAS